MSNYKCCKNKEFSNLVCVSCHGIFHPSCLERKNYKPIHGYKVYCSKKCEDSDKDDKLHKDLEKKDKLLKAKTEALEKLELEYEKNIVELQNEISLLEKDKREREEHYKKERRRTLDFEDEVFQNEESFAKELKVKVDEIYELNKTLAELHSKKQILEDNVQGYLAEIINFQKKMDELCKLNSEMREKVRLSEKENIDLKNQIADLCRNISPCDEKGVTSEKTQDKDVMTTTTEQQTRRNRNKILLIGDENVKGMINLLKTHTKYSFDINSHHLKINSLDDLLNNCLRYAKKFTENDYIITLLSPKISLQGKGVNCTSLRKLISACSTTNLIIIAPPFCKDRPVLNRFIEEDNMTIGVMMAAMKINRNYYFSMALTSDNGFISYDQKTSLVRNICLNILNKKPENHFFRAEHSQ